MRAPQAFPLPARVIWLFPSMVGIVVKEMACAADLR